MSDEFKDKYKFQDGKNVINFELAKARRDTEEARKKFEEAVKNPLVVQDLDDIGLEDEDEDGKKKRVYKGKKSVIDKIIEGIKEGKAKILDKKTGAIILAILAAGAAIGIIISNSKDDKETITDLIERKEDTNRLGLSKETESALTEYQEYFEGDNIEDKDVGGVADGLEQLYLDVIKEKISRVSGYPKDELVITPHTDKSDGLTSVSIFLQQDGDSKTLLYNYSGGRSDTLSEEIVDAISDVDNIRGARRYLDMGLYDEKKTRSELKSYFNGMNKFAAKEMIMDKDGKLAVIDYSETITKTAELDDRDER